MMNATAQIRLAQPADREILLDTIFFNTLYVHRHLAFRSPFDWLGSPYFLVAESKGEVAGALLFPEDPEGVIWIRLFIYDFEGSPWDSWSFLWEHAKQVIAERGGGVVATISLWKWYRELLEKSGFEKLCDVISLMRTSPTPISAPAPKGVTLRQMREEDIPAVAKVDAEAFEAMWRYSEAETRAAFEQAMIAVVAESEGEIAGYQISSKTFFGAHLARLAVSPKFQRRGVASALLSDLTNRLADEEIFKLSVNTQSDNLVARKLYEKLGFRYTDDTNPVYVYEVLPER